MSKWFADNRVRVAGAAVMLTLLAVIGTVIVLRMCRITGAPDELALPDLKDGLRELSLPDLKDGLRELALPDLKNGLRLVWIGPGSFRMGSARDEFAREADEAPQREVSIAKGFYIGSHEVMQREWQSVMGSNPSRFTGPERPVEGVSYHDALLFCERLSELTSRKVRLPKEAEWEYACRAGTTTSYSLGVALTRKQANFGNELGLEQGSEHPRSRGATPVGQYPPNAWGLYDVHGNVWEWCQDAYRRVAPKSDDAKSGTGREEDLRVVRGGAWLFGASDCRSASRTGYPATTQAGFVGFRVVVEE